MFLRLWIELTKSVKSYLRQGEADVVLKRFSEEYKNDFTVYIIPYGERLKTSRRVPLLVSSFQVISSSGFMVSLATSISLSASSTFPEKPTRALSSFFMFFRTLTLCITKVIPVGLKEFHEPHITHLR